MEDGRTRERAVSRVGAARLPVREGGEGYVKQRPTRFKLDFVFIPAGFCLFMPE